MISRFQKQVQEIDQSYITFDNFQTFQINIGDLCNQACRHCHVSAGPGGRKSMSRETMDRVISIVRRIPGLTVDITGGAPEMNPLFKYLVESLLPHAPRVMVRTNLTLLTEMEYGWLPEWYSRNGIILIASLPCYLEENVDCQRGNGVYEKSIRALKLLNGQGYGKTLELDIVYNPGKAHLPPDQQELEKEYKERLYERFGILFNYLFTITNAPIGRFGEYLISTGEHHRYMKLLMDSFNPDTARSIMCRTTINCDWQGLLYNCDFNQVKNMPLTGHTGVPLNLHDIDAAAGKGHPISMADHCYVCTAGAGSCCTGALDAG